jgi:hypothetical protein
MAPAKPVQSWLRALHKILNQPLRKLIQNLQTLNQKVK